MAKKFIKMITVALLIFTFYLIAAFSSENNNLQNKFNSVSSFIKSLKDTNRNNILSKLKDIIIVEKPDEGDSQMPQSSLMQDVLDKIHNFEGIKIVKGPNVIEIIKPIQKKPVKNNFQLEEIDQNKNNAVNDPGYKYEWDIGYTEADKAWSLIKQKREIKVAVLDTGVDYTHQDLKDRILKDKGYNFVNNNSDIMDDNGHGTHVAGIIAADANNGVGVSGITGTLDVKIIPIKVLNSNGEGDVNTIVKGIRYATDNWVDIINLSLGTNGKSREIARAINYAKSKGIFVVAAAGNDGGDSDNTSPASDGAFTVLQ